MSNSSPNLSEKSPVGVAIVGGGTVGGGVVQLLREHRDSIARQCGREVRVTHIVKRDLSNYAHLGEDAKPLLTKSWQTAVNDEKSNIIVELMGGEDEAAECIRAAIAAGKPVVTANKALLAARGGEFPDIAHEAAIAGCIPVVKILREALAADRVQEITGVINGTCNYILTAMENEQLPFADALRQAQQLGYAEAEPALDIDGMDAAHKLVLLARMGFGAKICMADLSVTGIRDFDRRDITFAKQFNFRIKQLASAKRIGNRLQVGVRPALIPAHHPLAAVEGATNAVVIRSDFAGETMYTGAGAGAKPTAVAVVADIVDIVRNRKTALPPGGGFAAAADDFVFRTALFEIARC